MGTKLYATLTESLDDGGWYIELFTADFSNGELKSVKDVPFDSPIFSDRYKANAAAIKERAEVLFVMPDRGD